MKFPDNLQYEKYLLQKGIKYVAGVDEVGRGPLAGPMVVGAVILDLENILDLEISGEKSLYTQIRDSKKISDKKRRKISMFLKGNAVAYSISKVEPKEIDKHGLTKVTLALFDRVVRNLKVTPEHIITDNIQIKTIARQNQTNLVKGDQRSISVSAASIVAKVFRDDIMIKFHEIYPQYGFAQHKGYGTKYHMTALNDYGYCEIHRKSFKPVKRLVT